MHKLDTFFSPQSIAVVGASGEVGKVGSVIAKNIANLGYAGKVFFVNPKHDEILGRECYSELKEIPEKIDLAIMVIPAKFVNRVIRESAKSIKNFVIISAGFAETSEEGEKREKELKKISEENGLNILGPNCLGFIIPSLNLNASFAGGMPGAGNISFVSQSGALAVAIMDIAKSEEIRFSSVISIGNKMQIDEAELLDYLGSDEKTKVIGMYLEGIKHGPAFMEAASVVSRKKPVVILKAGKSEKSQQAIASHTGALAGSDAIIDALFEKTGVLRARDFEDFFSLVNLISRTDAPLNDKVLVITNAGGPGVLTADAFEGKKIALANLSEETKEELESFLPEESSVENPVDLLGDALEDRYRKVLEIAEKEQKIGTIVCVLTPQDQTPVEKIAKEIIEFRKKTKKSMATIFIGGERVKESVFELERNGIPNFSFPDQCINALDKYFRWSKTKEGLAISEKKIDERRRDQAIQIIQNARKKGRSALLFSEARELMELYGILIIETKNVEHSGKTPANVSFPAVLKVDSDKVLHKTDKQGVILNIESGDELRKAIEKMRSNFPEENLIIQPMMARQTELIVGIKNDPMIGPVVVYGLGGIYTEIFRQVNFLIPPLSAEEVRNSLLKGKLGFLFQKIRGQKAHDLGEITEILQNISNLGSEIKEIKELDVNPLLVYNDGKKGIAVDVKIII
jgi:acetate---CoA ligase (ADP-forming)